MNHRHADAFCWATTQHEINLEPSHHAHEQSQTSRFHMNVLVPASSVVLPPYRVGNGKNRLICKSRLLTPCSPPEHEAQKNGNLTSRLSTVTFAKLHRGESGYRLGKAFPHRVHIFPTRHPAGHPLEPSQPHGKMPNLPDWYRNTWSFPSPQRHICSRTRLEPTATWHEKTCHYLASKSEIFRVSKASTNRRFQRVPRRA